MRRAGVRAAACDPRAEGLRRLVRYAGGVHKHCTRAASLHREDASREDREAAVTLELRATERLCREIMAAIGRLPRG